MIIYLKKTIFTPLSLFFFIYLIIFYDLHDKFKGIHCVEKLSRVSLYVNKTHQSFEKRETERKLNHFSQLNFSLELLIVLYTIKHVRLNVNEILIKNYLRSS